MPKPGFSPEVRERAVRLVQEHRGEYRSEAEAVRSVAGKFGCNPETLRGWLRRAERDAAGGGGHLTTGDERARLAVLERENRELRRANEILRKASAYFAQAELDRRGR